MASVYKRGRHYYASFRGSDGARRVRSTRTSDPVQAHLVADRFEQAGLSFGSKDNRVITVQLGDRSLSASVATGERCWECGTLCSVYRWYQLDHGPVVEWNAHRDCPSSSTPPAGPELACLGLFCSIFCLVRFTLVIHGEKPCHVKDQIAINDVRQYLKALRRYLRGSHDALNSLPEALEQPVTSPD